VSRRRSTRSPRERPEGPEQLPLVAPPRSRAGAEPEQAAKVAITRRAKPSALDLRRALAERLSAQAIREGRNLESLVIEILQAGAK
jgi:hypothetical protein